MSVIALVTAGESEMDQPAPGFGHVGGISLLERQVRQALKAGAEVVWVVATILPEIVRKRLAAEPRAWRAETAADLAGRLEGENRDVLMLAPGHLIDERLVAAMVKDRRAPLLMTFGELAPAGAERLDSGSHWAGLARLPAALVREFAASLGDWELSGTLLRAAIETGAERRQVEDLPLYAANRRRDLPFLWARPADAAAHKAATDSLVAAAQKGCLDWPARFIHPPVEDQIVRWLLDTPVTPNMVTLLTAMLGLAATIAFATGQLWIGLALVLVIGPLDGVDGKLARVRHEYSRWGDLEHVLDKIMEYAWFLALAGWFSHIGHGLAAWLIAGGIILCALSEAIQGEIFRRFTGRQLDDWGPFERRFRLVAGRRNTYFWTLLPFAALDLWFEGFAFILAYAVATFAISQWRFYRAVLTYGRDISDDVRRNMAATAYDFLPRQSRDTM